MKTTDIDLVLTRLPFGDEFTPASLMQVVDDIHAQWVAFMSGEEDESGWSADAGYGSLSAILPRFKSFIALEGCDLVFGFGDDCDRDCILSDYIGTHEETMLNKNVAFESVGSAMIPRKAAKKSAKKEAR